MDELSKIDKEVVETGNTALVDPRTQRARGFENFEQEDLLLPRIAIAQAMSKPVQDGEVKVGSLYNTLTKEIYADVNGVPYLEFVVVSFTKSRRLWDVNKKENSLCMSTDGRVSQSGKVCATECPFVRANVAKDIGINGAVTAYEWSEDRQGNRLAPACTAYSNYLSITAPFERAVMPVSVSMGRTSAKLAKQFNSFMMATGEDIFGRIYILSTEKKENSKGTFYVFKFKPLRKPNPPEYKRAELMANRLATTTYKIHEEGAEGDEAGSTDDEIPF